EAHDSVMQPLAVRRGETGTHTVVLDLTRSRQVFVFDDIDAEPVPSLARNLSAPVVVDCRYSDEALALLAAHDSDPFNRWEAAQRFIVERVVAIVDGADVDTSCEPLVATLGRLLDDETLDPAFREQLFQLPSEGFVA